MFINSDLVELINKLGDCFMPPRLILRDMWGKDSRGSGDRYFLYIAIPIAVVLMGIIIHDPAFLAQYTDYAAIYYRSHDRVLPGYPYIDYEFEYTPIIAALWLIASKTALYLSHLGYDPFASVVRSFYIINGFFYALYVYAIYKISEERRVPRALSMLSIASPSIIYYLFYNWDIVATLLMILGVYFFTKGRIYLSSLLLGLGSAVKIMPMFAVLSIFIAIMLREPRKALFFLLLSVLTAASPFLALLSIHPPGFFYFLSYHSQWYCENCFYILLTDNIYDQMLRSLSISLMLCTPIVYTIIAMVRRTGDPHRSSESGSMLVPLLSVTLSISFSYIYSPQMNIFLTPLYLFLKNNSKYILLAQDMLNTMIMVLWFHEKAISSFLNIESRGPWFRESPIQWIAFLRIVLIWILVLMAS